MRFFSICSPSNATDMFFRSIMMFSNYAAPLFVHFNLRTFTPRIIKFPGSIIPRKSTEYDSFQYNIFLYKCQQFRTIFLFLFFWSVRSILFAQKTNKIHGFFYKFISKGEFLGLKTEVKRTFVLTNRIFWCIMYSTKQNKCSPIRRRR